MIKPEYYVVPILVKNNLFYWMKLKRLPTGFNDFSS